MTAQGAFLKLSEIRQNQKTGQGPCTLAEMRREADLIRERDEAERQAEAKRQISFERFWRKIISWHSRIALSPILGRRRKLTFACGSSPGWGNCRFEKYRTPISNVCNFK